MQLRRESRRCGSERRVFHGAKDFSHRIGLSAITRTMPTLPSGRTLAISMNHIMPIGMVQFHSPAGHYWFRKPDHALNAPPFHPEEQTILSDWVHAPCPTTREEALAALELLEGRADDSGRLYWPGYFVGDPEALADLDAADRAAWDAWVALPKVQRFLDLVIDTCRVQAEANRHSVGFMAFSGLPGGPPEPGTPEAVRLEAAGRAGALATAARKLDGEPAEVRARNDELARILVALDSIVDDPARSCPQGWHARGVVARLLGRLADAERSFLEAVRHAPFSLALWLELARTRAEQGKFVEAEVAARRAVAIDHGCAPAWVYLAMALAELGHQEEAREAAERALSVDPDEKLAAAVLRRPA